MKFLEKDLEDIIWESDNERLREKGLDIYGKKLRQLKIGNYGIADLITVTMPTYQKECEYHQSFVEKGHITIFELKKDNISISSFLQLLGYAKGVKTYLEQRRKTHLFDISMILIGREIDLNSTFCYLPDFLIELELYTYKYGIDGLEFEYKNGYDLSNKGF